MDNVYKQLRILRKDKKEMLELKKTTVTKMKEKWGKNFCAGGYVKRNFQNWKTKRKKWERTSKKKKKLGYLTHA